MIFYRFLSWLPFPVLYFFAWIGYLLLYYVAGYRKSVVKQNLSRAFPEKSGKEVTVLAKKFYRQLAEVACEILKAQRMNPDDFEDRMEVINSHLVEQYSENRTKSVIVLTIHQANWEWMLHRTTTALDIPIDAVYKPLHNQSVDKLIFDLRSKFGSRPLSMEQSTRDILKRRKEFRLFVMVADQSPTRHDRSYWSSFMGQPAAFYVGAEVLAKMTGFPVLFAQCKRVSRGHYQMEFKELASPPYTKDSHDIVDRYIELAEQSIREQPESWLWSNRRWKRDRQAEEARLAGEQKS
jgi:Kdo2-lipid IVA lauroyltransferase/acyltransferase